MVLSNFVSLVASALVVLVLPRNIGVEAYSYFQLFLFYATYVGFLQGGWSDGVYLRYGGERYQDLPASLLGMQVRMLFVLMAVLSGAISVWTVLTVTSAEGAFVGVAVAISSIFLNVRVFFLYMLQGTNRIGSYSAVMVLDRVVYIVVILGLVLVGIQDFREYCIASVGASLVSLLAAALYCRDVLRARGSIVPRAADWNEARANVQVGVGLMLANVASLLLVGVVRFGIERSWGVVEFGRISLLLNLLTLVLTFVNAVAIVLFPMVRRVDPTRWAHWYSALRGLLMPVLFGLLLLYWPIRLALGYILPKYSDAFAYLAVLFPVFVFEGKQALLLNTYFKALRLERVMLVVNAIAVGVSLVLTVLTTIVFRSFEMTVAIIPVLVAFRSVLSDAVLSRELSVPVLRSVATEILLGSGFVALWSVTSQWWAIGLYAVLFGGYLVCHRGALRASGRAFFGEG